MKPIALVFDSDKTLTPDYMQRPLFDYYGLSDDEWNAFWVEKGRRVNEHRSNGLLVDGNMVWLNMILEKVKQGVFSGLTNELLTDLGSKIEFFPGLPEFFPNLKNKFPEQELEFYVITSGLRRMVLGSKIGTHLEEVYGCEYEEVNGEVKYVLASVDYTHKTRYLFEISKGSRELVNQRVNDKRIPWKNMVYVGDGPTDIPCFEVVKSKKGHCLAVYDGLEEELINHSLIRDERVPRVLMPNYLEDSELYKTICELITHIISH